MEGLGATLGLGLGDAEDEEEAHNADDGYSKHVPAGIVCAAARHRFTTLNSVGRFAWGKLPGCFRIIFLSVTMNEKIEK